MNAVDASLTKRYPECFSGIGKLKDYRAKIHKDPNVTPVSQNPRRIHFSLREKVEAKLKELLEEDIIACECLHIYLYGIDFKLLTDDKPLEF